MKIKKKTQEELIKDIIDTMFIIAEHNVTYEDIKDRKDQWYLQYTMTPEQENKWMEWLVGYLRKHRSYNKGYAKAAADWIIFQWGLKVIRPKVEQEND